MKPGTVFALHEHSAKHFAPMFHNCFLQISNDNTGKARKMEYRVIVFSQMQLTEEIQIVSSTTVSKFTTVEELKQTFTVFFLRMQ